MSKEKFLKELAYLLQDIPDEERTEALAYYEDYFDAAGEDNEAKVLAELQSPERVAALIKAGMSSNFEETIEYSESSMGDSRYNHQHEVIIPNEKAKYEEAEYKERGKSSSHSGFKGDKNRNAILLGVIIVVAIFGLPIFGVGFGFLVTILALIFSFGIVLGALGFASFISAIAIFIKSLWELGTYPAASLMGMGTSLLLGVLGIVLFKNIKWPFKVVPEIFRGGINIIRELFDKVRDKL